MPTNLLTIPTHQPKFTIRAIAYGAVLLAWLSTEDAHIWIAALLGTGLALMVVGLLVLRWLGGKTLRLKYWLLGGTIAGGLTGFSAVWCTVFLMVFKNAWHSHALPDFPAEVVTQMMERTPMWTLAGMLIGQSLALVRFIVLPQTPPSA